MYPRYSYPIQTMAALVRDGLLRRHRQFADDARACMARLSPPVQMLGVENIPAGGCFVITPNHYYRRGFASQWSPLAISAHIPAVHWVMTAELTFPGRWIAPLGMPVTRFALRRVAAVYGFTAMPPMPPRPRDVAARAAAVRRVLRYAAAAGSQPIIGLAPEGGDQPGGHLSMPPAGAGRFCLLLGGAGLRFLPVGVYEQDGRFLLSFGEPYVLQVQGQYPADERDRRAAFSVMSHIAPLLPAALRGEFASVAAA